MQPSLCLFNSQSCLLHTGSFTEQAPVVQTLDSAIHVIITIQWISITKINCVIHWIVIYPVDSAIHLLNNWCWVGKMLSLNDVCFQLS